MVRKKQIVVDIDGTLTHQPQTGSPMRIFYDITPRVAARYFKRAKPNKEMIQKVNEISKTHVICILTSRSDIYQDVTIKWLKKHKVKYDFLHMGKPFGEMYVDDKAIRPEEFLKLGKQARRRNKST